MKIINNLILMVNFFNVFYKSVKDFVISIFTSSSSFISLYLKIKNWKNKQNENNIKN